MRGADETQPTLSDPLRTVSDVATPDAADARLGIDLISLARVGDPTLARALAREALDDDPVAELMADVIQPFAGALVEVIQPILAWADEAADAAIALDDPEAVVGLIDEMVVRLNARFNEVFRPNEAMQDLLRIVTTLFDPLRQQVIDTPSTDVEFDLEMPPGFMDFIWAMADVFEQECPENWPRPLWFQAADAVIRHGVPIVGVVPAPVVERVVTAVEDGIDPFYVLAAAHEDILDAVSELTIDADLGATRPDVTEELAEVVALIRDGRYAPAIRSAFACVDALVYKREYTSYAAMRDAQIPSLDDVKFPGLRGALVRHCLAPCYEWHEIGTEVAPPRLNRHAVMHGVDRHHATLPNALTACLLAATLFDAHHRAATAEGCTEEAGRSCQ